MTNFDLEEYKTYFKNNLLIVSILLFVVIYVIMNYNQINNVGIFKGDIVKSVLITGIVVLLLYLYSTWDDENSNEEIQKYKLVNNNQKLKLSPPPFGNNDLVNNVQKVGGTNLENNSIFLPHKNISKFGIKF